MVVVVVDYVDGICDCPDGGGGGGIKFSSSSRSILITWAWMLSIFFMLANIVVVNKIMKIKSKNVRIYAYLDPSGQQISLAEKSSQIIYKLL